MSENKDREAVRFRFAMEREPVHYRFATEADAAACAAIQKPYIEKTVINFLYEPPTEADFAEKIRRLQPDYPFLVAETEQGKVVAFAYADAFRPHTAYRWDVETSIYVAEDQRGHGYGPSVYRRLLAVLDRQGYLTSYACIADPNPDSVAMHERMGFEHIGYFPASGYKLGAWHGIIWMARQPEKMPAPPETPRKLTDIETEDLL